MANPVDIARQRREEQFRERMDNATRSAMRGSLGGAAIVSPLPPGREGSNGEQQPSLPPPKTELVAVVADQEVAPAGTFLTWRAVTRPPSREGFDYLELPSTDVPLSLPAGYSVHVEFDWHSGQGGAVEVWVGDQRQHVSQVGRTGNVTAEVTAHERLAPLKVRTRHAGDPIRVSAKLTVQLGRNLPEHDPTMDPEETESLDELPTPDAPAAIPGTELDSAYVDLTWNPVAGAERYEAVVQHVEDGYTISHDVEDATEIRVEGLEPLADHRAWIVAHADDAIGSMSPSTDFTTPADEVPPATPEGFSAVAGFTSITASWNENREPDVERGAGYYRLELAEDDDGSPGAVIDTVETAGTITSFGERQSQLNPDPNLAPPWHEWDDVGTRQDGDTLILTDDDTTSVSVLIRTGGAPHVQLSVDAAVDDPSEHYDPDGGLLWSAQYYDADMEPVERDDGWTSNGHGQSLPPDGVYRRKNWNIALGAQVEWVRWGLRSGQAHTSPLIRYRLPAARIDSVEYVRPLGGLPEGTSFHLRVLAVDSSGNESDPTDWVTVSTAATPTVDLEERAIELIHLANGAIGDERLFVDGIIEGSFIKANTLTTRNLIVGSFDNLIQNPYANSGSLYPHTNNGQGTWEVQSSSGSWIRTGAHSIVFFPEGMTGTASLRLNGTWGSSTLDEHIQVAEGEEYIFSVYARPSGTDPGGSWPRARVLMLWRDADGNQVSSEDVWFDEDNSFTWQYREVTGKAPAGAAYLHCGVYVYDDLDSPVGQEGAWAFDDFYARRRVEGNLIVDGAITARTLAADELITLKAQIGEGIIDTAHIDVLNASVITTGSMHGNRITANTLDVNRLRTGTLTARTITLGTDGILRAGDASGARVEFSELGITAYNSSGGQDFALIPALNFMQFKGSITAGSTITGATFRTATSGKRVVIDDDNRITFYSGTTQFTELAAPFLEAYATSSRVGWRIVGGNYSHGVPPTLASYATSGGDEILEVTGTVEADGVTANYGDIGEIDTSSMDYWTNLWSGTAARAIPTNGYSSTGVLMAQDSIRAARDNNASGYFGRVGTTNGRVVQFSRRGTTVGGVSVTTTATSFDTSSDYRLKTNVREIDGALDRLLRWAPYLHDWVNGDDPDTPGFVAHELGQYAPYAVQGEKDEVDEDGEPVYQSVDLSKLVPEIVAAIQELAGNVGSLRRRVDSAA